MTGAEMLLVLALSPAAAIIGGVAGRWAMKKYWKL